MSDGLSRAARRTGFQVGGVWSVQVVGMVLQLAYTATVSRLVAPEGFGAYGVALATLAPLSILAGLGLGNAAARRVADDAEGDRAVVGAAVLSGGFWSLVVFLLAGPLADLWGNPQAMSIIRAMCITVLFGPYSGVLAGLLRRQGRIGLFNAVALGATVLGMTSGALAVWWLRNPLSLTVMPVVTALFTAGASAAALRSRAWPGWTLGRARPEIVFGSKSMGLSLMAAVSYAFPMWAMSRTLGASTFGSWNRAVVVGSIPLESLNRSVVTVVYPKFREHSEEERGMWSDMLAASAWLLVVPAAVAVPLMPAVVRLLIGPEWQLAGEMAQWLWVAAAITVPVTLLAMALESSNHFRAIWLGQAVLGVTSLVAAVAVWLTGSWIVVAAAFLVGAAAAHALQMAGAARLGLLDSPRVLRTYGLCLIAAALMWVAGGLIARLVASPSLQVVLGALIVGLYYMIVWKLRHRMRPMTRLASGSRPEEGTQ